MTRVGWVCRQGGAAAVLHTDAEAMEREMSDFVSAVREGRRSLAVVRAVYESARTGQTVLL